MIMLVSKVLSSVHKDSNLGYLSLITKCYMFQPEYHNGVSSTSGIFYFPSSSPQQNCEQSKWLWKPLHQILRTKETCSL